YPIRIEETTFNLSEYQRFLDDNQQDIAQFTEARNQAFDEELQRWVESGQINFQSEQDLDADNGAEDVEGTPVESPTAGNIWKLNVAEGDTVKEGDVVAVLESMKMEIEIHAPASGTVIAIARQEGQQINAGQAIMVLE
ncbi:MAG: biotin/lipoyl-containing protein, partial [Oceanospirillum sp.]|nr:biotin/lipoyl-containing protein [Oceanospirillum sp.]